MNGYQYNPACPCTRCRSQRIMGPVLLITFGILFLLANLDVPGFEFRHTWPVILLVIGGVKLLQNNAPTQDHMGPRPPAVTPTETAPPSLPSSRSEVSDV